MRKQWRRNRVAFGADRRRDPGVLDGREPVRRSGHQPRLPRALRDCSPSGPATTLGSGRRRPGSTFASRSRGDDPGRAHRLPGRDRRRAGASSRARVEALAAQADLAQHLYEALRALGDPELPAPLDPSAYDGARPGARRLAHALRRTRSTRSTASRSRCCARGRSAAQGVTAETYSYDVRGAAVTGENYRDTLSGLQMPKVAAPRLSGWGDLLRFLMSENLPGAYPVHGGRLSPTGARARIRSGCSRAKGCPSARTAASTTSPPASRRCGSRRRSTPSRSTARTQPSARTSGARSGTPASRSRRVDDAKRLYSGFDLCAPSTSVSMTINGPAPIILAFFINAAIDQQVEKHLRETGAWEAVERALPAGRPVYRGALPGTSDGLGAGAARRRRRRGRRRARPTTRIKAETLRRCGGRCRPTSSRRIRPRTRASSRPSSR